MELFKILMELQIQRSRQRSILMELSYPRSEPNGVIRSYGAIRSKDQQPNGAIKILMELSDPNRAIRSIMELFISTKIRAS
ncbi:hypothetical protein HNY73_015164 [Argiope bruennichi]|uniref:Uncharacterized protein n=1 Tax=Argiope bruennichi TaxID=94029 RepID=A0A8T0ERH9_ARGBR|nr:hypothetical protein HNY73_015164 [Argiope bruennichi]